jgi:hypothetical protein
VLAAGAGRAGRAHRAAPAKIPRRRAPARARAAPPAGLVRRPPRPRRGGPRAPPSGRARGRPPPLPTSERNQRDKRHGTRGTLSLNRVLRCGFQRARRSKAGAAGQGRTEWGRGRRGIVGAHRSKQAPCLPRPGPARAAAPGGGRRHRGARRQTFLGLCVRVGPPRARARRRAPRGGAPAAGVTGGGGVWRVAAVAMGAWVWVRGVWVDKRVGGIRQPPARGSTGPARQSSAGHARQGGRVACVAAG